MRPVELILMSPNEGNLCRKGAINGKGLAQRTLGNGRILY